MSQLAVQLSEIEIELSGVRLFQCSDLRIFRGQRVGIMGPSGAGKSLLLKALCDLISFRGKRWIAEDQVLAKVFQKNALFDSMTASQNVELPLVFQGIHSSRRKTKVLELLQQVGLGTSGLLFPSEMSGGMQKRLGLARALAMGPNLLFCDDPSAGLDPLLSREIYELLRSTSQNRTLVFTTNEVARAQQVADRLLVLLNGRIAFDGDWDQLSGAPIEVRSFLFPRDFHA
ncbi:MAG: ATP-binding cassette domain-containing protein [Bdellovibrio sp.]